MVVSGRLNYCHIRAIHTNQFQNTLMECRRPIHRCNSNKPPYALYESSCCLIIIAKLLKVYYASKEQQIETADFRIQLFNTELPKQQTVPLLATTLLLKTNAGFFILRLIIRNFCYSIFATENSRQAVSRLVIFEKLYKSRKRMQQ